MFIAPLRVVHTLVKASRFKIISSEATLRNFKIQAKIKTSTVVILLLSSQASTLPLLLTITTLETIRTRSATA